MNFFAKLRRVTYSLNNNTVSNDGQYSDAVDDAHVRVDEGACHPLCRSHAGRLRHCLDRRLRPHQNSLKAVNTLYRQLNRTSHNLRF